MSDNALYASLILLLSQGCAAVPNASVAIDQDPYGIGKADFAAAKKMWPSPSIPVCWEESGAAPEHAQARGWVKDAVETSWSAYSAVRFEGWNTCTRADRGLRIGVAADVPHTDGLGTDLDGKKQGMVLNFTFQTWSLDCQSTREFCVRAGAVHEFGHALGFAHEHNRADTPGWCGRESGAWGDVSFGSWDPDSVMNYCNAKWTGDGKLSKGDIVGVRAHYGRAPGTIAAAITNDDVSVADDTEWASGLLPARARAFGDVDGDGDADAVLLLSDGRTLQVSLSSGRFFVTVETWGTLSARVPVGGTAGGARSPEHMNTLYAADVDGDKRADAVIFDRVRSSLAYLRSTGASFESPRVWGSLGPGAANASSLLVADVNGDSRTDVVHVDHATGSWTVAAGGGEGLLANATVALREHGAQAQGYWLADVSGDGRADAITMYASTGDWWVAPANGTGGFERPSRWLANHGALATSRFVADVNGDGRADAVVHERRVGGIWVATSTGTAFSADKWLRNGIGASASGIATTLYSADVTGDARADFILTW